MTAAGIYVRISQDREGAGLGVARQEQDCRELAKRLGWDVVDVYSDNDMSAYSGKPRRNYQRLMGDVRTGRISSIIAWHTDRLHRHPRELEEFISLLEAHRVQVHTVKAGELDLSTPSGRMVARQLGAVARYESEHKSERVRRKLEEKAKAGEIIVGGHRAFGYTRIYAGTGPGRKIVRDELNAEEAAVIRECVRRVLAGASLRSVTRWLNEDRKIPTSTGKPWSQASLRTTLRAGRLAGLVEHRGQLVGDAEWEPVISRAEHERVRAVLDGHHRFGHTVRRHYLTGLVFCSDCAEHDGPAMQVSRHRDNWTYQCPPKSLGGCRGRAINVPQLEKMLRKYVIARASDPAILRELAQAEHRTDTRAEALMAQVEADERRLAQLAPQLSDGDDDVDLLEVVAAVRRIRRRIRDTRAEIGELLGMSPSISALLPDLADRWDEIDLEARRAVTEVFVERVLIAPAVPGRNFFDPARVDVVPRGRR